MTAYPPLDGGELRDLITIQAPIYVADGGGGQKLTGWATVADKVPAEVVPISGGETFLKGIERRSQFYRIRIRFRSDLSPANRLQLGGVALNIRSCGDPNREREQLLIMAESGVADG